MFIINSVAVVAAAPGAPARLESWRPGAERSLLMMWDVFDPYYDGIDHDNGGGREAG